MTIPETVVNYLDHANVNYQIHRHAHTASSLQSAYSAHVPAEQIAKGVLLWDEIGYVLAVIPASNTLELETLNYLIDRKLELATEEELGDVFDDCALGAVPAIGWAYRVPTIVDEELLENPRLYFEAGDHEELILVEEADFETLMEGAEYGRFSNGEPE
ncbi:MAG TPA: YbaK/EbsC family protein [Chromatiales bacterium]|nr:YbaK/EbsC family protein [Thiotrichales bacterium]HIP68016.1 YbaK/EbsC family protein [Chromatiales bacterium]